MAHEKASQCRGHDGGLGYWQLVIRTEMDGDLLDGINLVDIVSPLIWF